MDVTYEEAIADLIAEAQRTAAWLTKFCCSHRGYEHGLDLIHKLDAVGVASDG